MPVPNKTTPNSSICRLSLLGGASVQRIPEDVEIDFPTRKAKALLIYLAMAPNYRASRSKLAGIFWSRSAEEQARASLRQTIASLRKVLTFDVYCLLDTSSDDVFLKGDMLDIDVVHFEQQTDDDVDATELAVTLYKGDFLDGFSINEDSFETWARDKQKNLSELAIQKMTSLCYFWMSFGDLDKSITISKNILVVDPLHESSHQTLMRLYTLIGRRESAIKQYQECKKVLMDELNVEPQVETSELYKKIINREPLISSAKPHNKAAPVLHESQRHTHKNKVNQEIRYCLSEDGVRIAYAIAGEGNPIIKCGNWMTHLEFDWHTPIWRHLNHFLIKNHTLVRYDARGNGLSDWDVDDIGQDEFVKDLEAVANASGFKKFILFGVSQGCAISIAYAVHNPDRISHLILYGGFARGWRHGGKEEVITGEAFSALTKQGWGLDNPAYRQLFTSLFIPDGTYEQMAWFNELQRKSASAKNAVKYIQATGQFDVRDQLKKISVPTLILHCKDDEKVQLSMGQELAKGIPNAKFVELEGRNHLILEQELAWGKFLSEFETFISTQINSKY